MSLGAGETNLLSITNAYGMIINGKKITPTLIDRVQDRRGNTIFCMIKEIAKIVMEINLMHLKYLY